MGPRRPARGALRPRRSGGPGPPTAARPGHPVPGLLRPEPRQALSAALPLVRAVVVGSGRRRLHLQSGGRPDPAAQGSGRRARAAPARRRHRAVPPGRPGPPRGRAAGGLRRPAHPPQGGGRPAAGGCPRLPAAGRDLRVRSRVSDAAGAGRPARDRRPGRVRRPRPRRPDARCLRAPRRAGGALGGDARVGRTVRPRGRRGTGRRCPGGGQRERGPPRRRRRERDPRAGG